MTDNKNMNDMPLLRAIVYLEEGKLEEAQECCLQVLQHEPSNAVANNLLGLVLQRKSDLSGALEAFDKAIDQNRGQPSYKFNKAVVLSLLKRTEESLSLAQEALRGDPGNIEINRFIKEIYAQQGKHEKAERHAKQMMKLHAEQHERKHRRELDEDQRQLLLSAFSEKLEILLEDEKRILIEGKRHGEGITESFMTSSWDQYFRDLSSGSYRVVKGGDRRSWRPRTWHFLFKNLALVERLFAREKKTLKLLDIGCSTGYLRRFIEGNASDSDENSIYYWGVDIREDVLRCAVEGTEEIESGARGCYTPSAFLLHDIAYGLPYRVGFFDVVVSFETIKYLPIEQGRKHLNELRRIMAKGGELYISNSFEERHEGYMLNVPFSQFEEMLKDAGFAIEACYGSQSNYESINKAISAEHRSLFDALSQYHPKEITAAMVAPLYPEVSGQRMYRCR